MSTDIKVRGQARDTRVPDRAEVHLTVSQQGRDAVSTHEAVATAVSRLTSAIAELVVQHPEAVGAHSLAQISQRSWTDDAGTMFQESAWATVEFTDFQVMSRWVFAQTSDQVQMDSIDWKLAPPTRDRVNSALSTEAVRDARRRAETFAKATGLTIVGVRTLADPGLMTDRDNTVDYASSPMPRMAMMKSAAVTPEIDFTPALIETEVRVEAHFIAE